MYSQILIIPSEWGIKHETSKEALGLGKIPSSPPCPPSISSATWKNSELSPSDEALGLTEIPRSPPYKSFRT